MRLAVDTNVIVYAEGVGHSETDKSKALAARQVLEHSLANELFIPRQVLAELHWVLVRKERESAASAAGKLRRWAAVAEPIDTDEAVFDAALELAERHGFVIFDAIILAAAAVGRCDMLLSEDMQDGFAWRGVLIANPFAATPEPRIARLLAG